MIPSKKKHKRIYVIDNDRDVVDAITAILKRKGYEVGCLNSDSENIVDGAAAFRPDAILLDLISTSPAAGELAIAHALKQFPATSHIPIVMLSSAQAQEMLLYQEGLPKSIDGFVSRPVTSVTLLEQIQRVAA